MPELDGLQTELRQVSDLIIALAKVGQVQVARHREITRRIAELTQVGDPEATQAITAKQPQTQTTVPVRPSQLAGMLLWLLDGTSVHIWRDGSTTLCGLDEAMGPSRWRPYQPDLRGWVDVCAACWNHVRPRHVRPRQEQR